MNGSARVSVWMVVGGLLAAPAQGEEPAQEGEQAAVPLEGEAPPVAAPAQGEEPAQEGEQAAVPLEGPRPVPDYDGRPDAPPTVGQGLLWLPRVALAPAWAGWRYVLYPPVQAAFVASEKNHLPRRVRSVFVHRVPPAEVGVLPTGLVDFGLRPSVGVYGWGQGQVAPWPRTRVHFAWGGEDWWRATLRERLSWGGEDTSASQRHHVDAAFIYSRRPDNIFFGIGPDGVGPATRFAHGELGGRLGTHLRLSEPASLDLGLALTRHRFGAGVPLGGDPSIEEVYDVEDPAVVPGFDGYTAGVVSADLNLRRPAGGRLDGGLHLGTDLVNDLQGDSADFLRTRVRAMGALDLDGHHRRLALLGAAAWTRVLGDGEIAFTELPALGGDVAMRGFLEDSLRGASALSSALEYTWPVWAFADGLLFAELGEAFGPDFQGVALTSMRLSAGTGLRTQMADGVAAQFLVGVGTTPLDEPTGLDSIRIAIGINRGL